MTGTREVLLNNIEYISGNLLDLGAGNAKYKSFLESHARKYTAFDVQDGPNIDVVGDIHKLPFPENTFDTIICTQVFEHIQKPWLVTDQIKKILKPGGYAIITAPFMVPYHAHPYDFYRFTTEGISKIFEGKIECVEVGTYGKTFVVIAELIRFEYLSPYKKHGRLKKYFFNKTIKFLHYLDKFSKSTDTYSNVYVILKK